MSPQDDTCFYAVFPARLRAAREARGLSMERLAELTELHMFSIYRLEKGLRRPRSETLIRLCRVLGICPSSLFPPLETWCRASQSHSPLSASASTEPAAGVADMRQP